MGWAALSAGLLSPAGGVEGAGPGAVAGGCAIAGSGVPGVALGEAVLSVEDELMGVELVGGSTQDTSMLLKTKKKDGFIIAPDDHKGGVEKN